VPRDVLPGWIDTFGKFNPVAYAVEASRNLMVGVVENRTLSTAIDWGQLGRATAFLVGVAILGLALARIAFRKATA
jgi:hypothetical protein